MKTRTGILGASISAGLFLFLVPARAAIHYVNAAGTNPVAPFTSWATAATNIQDAITAAVPFDTVLVTNGIYNTGGYTLGGITNRIYASVSHLTVRSVNGPSVTVVQGNQVPGTTNGLGAIRCVNLANTCSLSGFTLTNGATPVSATGGGVQAAADCTISNCLIIGNSAATSGGGVYGGRVVNSVIIGNTAMAPSTGSGGGAAQSTLINCVIAGNKANLQGGGAQTCVLINCTVTGNTGQPNGLDSCKVRNSISYFNTPNNGEASGDANTFSNCCLAAFPFSGFNIITNPPAFASQASGNFHLSAISPCINAGINDFNTNSTDLDGNPRLVAGSIDLGAYEFQSPIHFVNVSNTAPVPPYTNWLTAATNIQNAVDASAAGDFVLVSTGVYKIGGRIVYGSSSNRVVIDKPVTVASVNGPAVTAIQGFQGAAAPYGTRCVYMTNGAVLSGFTLSVGGSAGSGDNIFEKSGGAVWCESTDAVLSNCVVSGNFAAFCGGGVFRGTLLNCVLTNNQAAFGGGGCSNVLVDCWVIRNSAPISGSGGGVYQGVLNNCVISNNQAFISGGGLYNSFATNCLLVTNSLVQGTGGGGAVYGVLNHCRIVGNFVPGIGGGAYSNILYDCIVSNNTAGQGGGVARGIAYNSLISSNTTRFSGPGGGAFSNLLINCILRNNFAQNGGGAHLSTLINCTVASNTATSSGGGINASAASNCVVYFNAAPTGPNYASASLNWCDTLPLPAGGFGNITNDPQFVVLAADLHLQSNSPCINSGNNAVITFTTDYDGLPRIAGGTVDFGAYEFQSPGSQLSYAYLQQYGLPTDGSADNGDPDGDGMNNFAEWRAGTNPNDAASLLQLTSATPTNVVGVVITWQSVNGQLYFLQRGMDLALPLPLLQSNIVGQAGFTSYTDTNATDGDRFFYRVGVQ